jgi:hypothetical protein
MILVHAVQARNIKSAVESDKAKAGFTVCGIHITAGELS